MPIDLVVIVGISAVLHASWNLAAHAQRNNGDFFRQLSLVGAAIGIGPAIFFELTSAPLPSTVWLFLGITGLFQAFYYFGLTQGYRHGDFSVVYPVARALPVLILAGVDLLRGRPPSGPGWLGLFLVFAGCILAPQVSLRQFSLKRYWTRATIWIGVIAMAMVGYTTVDKMAAELMPPGPLSAVRYGALEYLAVVPYLWLLMRAADILHIEGAPRRSDGNWKWPATIPGTVRSSSSASQRKAYPHSRRVTSLNCSSVAFFKIRKRSAGNPMIRPSVSST